MDNSGAILGPLIAFMFLYFMPGDYKSIFLWATIPAILGVLSIIVFIKEAGNKTDEKIKFQWKQLPKKFYFFLIISNSDCYNIYFLLCLHNNQND